MSKSKEIFFLVRNITVIYCVYLYFTPVNPESESYAAVTNYVDQLFYCRGEDAAKALTASQGKRFFGTLIEVQQHEGIGRCNGLDKQKIFSIKL